MIIKLAFIRNHPGVFFSKGTSVARNFKFAKKPFLKVVGKGASVGAVGGAVEGTTIAHKHNHPTDMWDRPIGKPKKEWSYKKSALIGAGIGATIGGIYTGAKINDAIGFFRQQKAANRAGNYRWAQGQDGNFGRKIFKGDMKPDNPFHIKGFKTKKEAKDYYRVLARKHHPDAGGKESDFKNLQDDWADYQPKFEKLSHLIGRLR